ncbi:MAG: chemotaxis protein CheB [Actinomycetota bacterium]|nr:chemotaxis protein CheB [Actinomycetota bacterium]
MSDYELIAVGASWGGLEAVGRLLETLPDELDVPLAVAQHRGADGRRAGLAELLQATTSRPVRDVTDKEPIARGAVYLAPPDYHLLVEPGHFALSVDARVNYARPSVDVLFESAADAYGPATIGIVLTGANEDGAAGLARIKEAGGVAIVQDPATAERAQMPEAALAATSADVVLPLGEIGPFLRGLCLGSPARAVPARAPGARARSRAS